MREEKTIKYDSLRFLSIFYLDWELGISMLKLKLFFMSAIDNNNLFVQMLIIKALVSFTDLLCKVIAKFISNDLHKFWWCKFDDL